MKVLFAGPSLAADRHGLAERYPDIAVVGPVARGDVHRWTRRGATAIGIVDGLFREVPPVWHKEILFALAEGVAVAGGASMGALRAAECAAFGMVGLGDVFRLYAEGIEIDDAAVAQVHAPEELGWTALSEAAVTVDATVVACARARTITTAEADRLHRACRAIFHADRSFSSLAAVAIEDTARRAVVVEALIAGRDDVKRRDGLLVVDWLARQPGRRDRRSTNWQFAETGQWRAFLAELDSGP